MINKVKVGEQTEELGNFIISLKKPTGDFRPRIWIRPFNQYLHDSHANADMKFSGSIYTIISNYYNSASHYVEFYIDDTTKELKVRPTSDSTTRKQGYCLHSISTTRQSVDSMPIILDSYQMLSIDPGADYAINIVTGATYSGDTSTTTITTGTTYGFYWYDENEEYISEEIRTFTEDVTGQNYKEVFTAPTNARYCIALTPYQSRTISYKAGRFEKYSSDNSWYRWGIYLYDDNINDYDDTLNICSDY